MAKQPDILVIMTGGTIDAEPYDATPEFVTPLEQSLIPDLVRELGYADDMCDFFQWIMKDSQDFSEAEIRELAEIIRHDDRSQFIITHGTDAMIDNAALLEKFLEGSGKTVFFVGAMEPLTHGPRSDGQKNLMRALDTIADVNKEHGEGVFIIGRGEVAKGKLGACMFKPEEAVKDRERKIFVQVEQGMGR